MFFQIGPPVKDGGDISCQKHKKMNRGERTASYREKIEDDACTEESQVQKSECLNRCPLIFIFDFYGVDEKLQEGNHENQDFQRDVQVGNGGGEHSVSFISVVGKVQ